MEYDPKNAESLMHKHGVVAVIVHRDQLNRQEKEIVRNADNILQVGDSFVLVIPEEPEDYDTEALALYEEYEDDQRVEVTTVEDQEPVLVPTTEPEQVKSPTVTHLERLTVAQLRDLADKEALDISGLKVKADLVGRLCAHFGIDL